MNGSFFFQMPIAPRLIHAVPYNIKARLGGAGLPSNAGFVAIGPGSGIPGRVFPSCSNYKPPKLICQLFFDFFLKKLILYNGILRMRKF